MAAVTEGRKRWEIFPVVFSLGAQRTSASHAALCLAWTPPFASLIAMAMERNRPPTAWLAGAPLALIGEVTLIGARDPHLAGNATLLGDVLVLASSLGQACGFVAGGRLSVEIGSWKATFWSVTLASLILSPHLAMRATAMNWGHLSLLVWATLVHLTLGAGVIAFAAWFYGLARGGLARVSVLQFGQPNVRTLKRQ